MGINIADIQNPKTRDQILRQTFGAEPLALKTHTSDGGSAPCEREADLHDEIIALCRRRGWYYVHSRMDRRSTIGVGTPDFAIALPGGKMVWLECKRRGGKATPAQLAAIAQLRRLGHTAFVVDNLEDVLALCLTATEDL